MTIIPPISTSTPVSHWVLCIERWLELIDLYSILFVSSSFHFIPWSFLIPFPFPNFHFCFLSIRGFGPDGVSFHFILCVMHGSMGMHFGAMRCELQFFVSEVRLSKYYRRICESEFGFEFDRVSDVPESAMRSDLKRLVF